MTVNYTEVKAVRYGNSTVYGITLEVDGILCLEEESLPAEEGEELPSASPKIFRLQIVDDVADKAAAFQEWLDKLVMAVRESRSPSTPPSLTDIMGGQE
jgi:hypothetical protein